MGPSKCTPKLRAENHDEEAIPAAGTQGTCGVYSQPNVAAYANICDSLSCLCMARYQVIACMPLLSLVLAVAACASQLLGPQLWLDFAKLHQDQPM